MRVLLFSGAALAISSSPIIPLRYPSPIALEPTPPDIDFGEDDSAEWDYEPTGVTNEGDDHTNKNNNNKNNNGDGDGHTNSPTADAKPVNSGFLDSNFETRNRSPYGPAPSSGIKVSAPFSRMPDLPANAEHGYEREAPTTPSRANPHSHASAAGSSAGEVPVTDGGRSGVKKSILELLAEMDDEPEPKPAPQHTSFGSKIANFFRGSWARVTTPRIDTDASSVFLSKLSNLLEKAARSSAKLLRNAHTSGREFVRRHAPRVTKLFEDDKPEPTVHYRRGAEPEIYFAAP